jgi:hypothetical protein
VVHGSFTDGKRRREHRAGVLGHAAGSLLEDIEH